MTHSCPLFDKVLLYLDELIESQSVLQHPFYQSLSSGALSYDELAIYAWVYYPHVVAFPDYIREAMKITKDPTIQALLEENLQDELQEPEPHTDLWLYFAEGFGVSRQELQEAAPIPEVTSMISTFKQLCQQSPLGALAALYTYESQQPEVSRIKSESLQDLYHVEDQQTLLYFSCHQEADLKHKEDAREAMLLCLQRGDSSHFLFESAQAALDAHWQMLDGVCRQAGISC